MLLSLTCQDTSRQALYQSRHNSLGLDLVYFMIHFIVMIRLNIHEAKTHLSRYLELLAAGEVILLCKRNTPIAEIRGLAPERQDARPIGLAKGRVTILPDFDHPLPQEFADAFGSRKEG